MAATHNGVYVKHESERNHDRLNALSASFPESKFLSLQFAGAMPIT